MIDLFIVAWSKRIISTVGRFAILGQAWLGKDGPRLISATTNEKIAAVMEELLDDSGCKGIKIAI